MDGIVAEDCIKQQSLASDTGVILSPTIETANDDDDDLSTSSSLYLLADVVLSSRRLENKKPCVVKSILKKHSDYPKALSLVNMPAVRMEENGEYRYFAKDKYGNVIPFLQSFLWTYERYKRTARCAVANHLSLRQKRQRSNQAPALHQVLLHNNSFDHEINANHRRVVIAATIKDACSETTNCS
jgi:hypothetical protein